MASPFLFCVSVFVFQRCQARYAFELSIEVRDVVKATVKGDIENHIRSRTLDSDNHAVPKFRVFYVYANFESGKILSRSRFNGRFSDCPIGKSAVFVLIILRGVRGRRAVGFRPRPSASRNRRALP